MRTLTTILLLFALSAKSQDIPDLNKRIVEAAGDLLDSIGDSKLSENFINYVLEKNNAGMPRDNRIEIEGLFIPEASIIYPGDLMLIKKLRFREEFTVGEYVKLFDIQITKMDGIIVLRIDDYTFEIVRQGRDGSLYKSLIKLKDMVKGNISIYRPILK